MEMQTERQKIADYGIRMLDEGLVEATSGNISIFDPASGHMAISPSGMDYRKMKPEDVVILDLFGNKIEGERKPSSEYGLHASVYRARKDARAVVHTHSTYCTVLGILGQKVEAVHFILANVVGRSDVPLVPYYTYGTKELADAVELAMKGSPAVLLQNHGMAASGDSIESAYLAAQSIESVARLQYLAEAVGTPMHILNEREVRESYEHFSTSYGQKN